MPSTPLPRIAGAALVAAGLATAGCTGGTEQEGAQERPPPEVGVVKLRTQAQERTTTLPGRATAYRVAEVRPQASGIIRERLFEQGSTVSAGDALYQIDPDRYQAEVDQAKAQLEEARATVGTARRDVERLEELTAADGASEQELDDARDRLQQNKARVRSARASLAAARIRLDYATVEAPIPGRMSQSFITEGTLVTANQDRALARITQLDPIYVDIQRPADQARRLQRAVAEGELERTGSGGARVELMLDGGTRYEHEGELTFSGVHAGRATGSVTLRAVFPNPDHKLMPGMFVRARLTEGTDPDALLVPQQGVTRNRQGQATALVVNDDDQVEKRRLTVERAEGTHWIVEDGLASGDRVIVSGLQRARPGQPVRPTEAEIPNQPEGAE